MLTTNKYCLLKRQKIQTQFYITAILQVRNISCHDNIIQLITFFNIKYNTIKNINEDNIIFQKLFFN